MDGDIIFILCIGSFCTGSIKPVGVSRGLHWPVHAFKNRHGQMWFGLARVSCVYWFLSEFPFWNLNLDSKLSLLYLNTSVHSMSSPSIANICWEYNELWVFSRCPAEHTERQKSIVLNASIDLSVQQYWHLLNVGLQKKTSHDSYAAVRVMFN